MVTTALTQISTHSNVHIYYTGSGSRYTFCNYFIFSTGQTTEYPHITDLIPSIERLCKYWISNINMKCDNIEFNVWCVILYGY